MLKPFKKFDLSKLQVPHLQAFVKTAATIFKKIQDGVFDVSNEVDTHLVSFYFDVHR